MRYRITIDVDAESEDQATLTAEKMAAYANDDAFILERVYTPAEMEAYSRDCHENGEIECTDPAHHVWAISDENENYCYCEKCGCCEY